MNLFANHVTFIRVLNSQITDFWGVVTALSTLGLGYLAFLQLQSLSKTSRSDFIHKFKNDFFTDKTREIFVLIDNNKIKYINNGKFSIIGSKKTLLSYDLDDLVLGHFEDLGTFEKRGIVEIGLVYDLFDYYISSCYENKEIQKYIKSQGEGDIYENFEYIYKKCKSLEAAKKAQAIIFFWELEWNVKIIFKNFFSLL